MAEIPQKKSRMSITLSAKTGDMIRRLRASTDADSDSEVVRNSIRLAFTVWAASQKGSQVILEESNGDRTPVQLTGMPLLDAIDRQLSAGDLANNLDISARIDENFAEIRQLVDHIVEMIDETTERVRGRNSLSTEERDEALEALNTLRGVTSEVAEDPKNKSENSQEEQIRLVSWPQRFRDAIARSLRATFDAENIAEAVLPTGIIVACSALGAIVAGPVGFGAGSVLGHLLTGQIKPSSAAKKIEELRPNNSD